MLFVKYIQVMIEVQIKKLASTFKKMREKASKRGM